LVIRLLKEKVFELSDHLGNVTMTLSDQKQAKTEGYAAQILSYQQYYPFGWEMPRRKYNSGNYRFGFNGKENDKEWGNQLIQDYGFRLYNPAIGKFLSVDPLSPDYPWYTPYQFAGNKPIAAIDLDGLEEYLIYNYYNNNGLKTRTVIRVNRSKDGVVNMGGKVLHRGKEHSYSRKVLVLGKFPDGSTRFETMRDELSADEQTIYDAGADNSRVLHGDMKKGGVRNKMIRSETTNKGVFSFPDSEAPMGENYISEAFIGTYTNTPIMGNVPIPTRVNMNQSIGLSFMNPNSGAVWGQRGISQTMAQTMAIINNAINTVINMGGTVNNVTILRGAGDPTRTANITQFQQNQNDARANVLFNNTRTAIQAAFPGMGVNIQTPAFDPNINNAPSINIQGTSIQMNMQQQQVGTQNVLTTP